MNVITYRDGDAYIGAELAVKYRLYVPGWRLRGELLNILRERHIDSVVSIGFLENTPICVAVMHRGAIMAFTRKAMRRKGYGLKIVLSCLTDERIPVTECGVKGSNLFWKKVVDHIERSCNDSL